MESVDDKLKAELQVFSESESETGEGVKSWETISTLDGYLDLISGDSKYPNSDTETSTHVFIADYVTLPDMASEDSRMLIEDKVYDVLLIEDVDELDKYYRIYLKLIEDV